MPLYFYSYTPLKTNVCTYLCCSDIHWYSHTLWSVVTAQPENYHITTTCAIADKNKCQMSYSYCIAQTFVISLLSTFWKNTPSHVIRSCDLPRCTSLLAAVSKGRQGSHNILHAGLWKGSNHSCHQLVCCSSWPCILVSSDGGGQESKNTFDCLFRQFCWKIRKQIR